MIEVRDKKNHDRLLGYIPTPPMPPTRTLKFPICYLPMAATYRETWVPDNPPYEFITMDVILRTHNVAVNAWHYVADCRHCLVTDEPLEKLRAVRGWQFPGESRPTHS